ncbi:MAG: ATP-dependent helicase [Actinobacteria bacterium]|nr:MAG: ATP-dependent helicase [Actinomycetota bacterium]
MDSQWDEAVVYRGGRLVVLGVAGSGKTRLIEQRFAWLVDHGVAPERIAVAAASPARAAALRASIEVDLGQAYEQLCIGSPVELAALILGADSLESLLGAGDRLAMLLERIDELSLAHHDFGGSASALLGRFVRRIDRLKEESIGAQEFAAWADALADDRQGPPEREFAEVYRSHEQMLADACARDQGDLLRDALKLVRSQPPRFEHALVDDGQELSFAAASLVAALAERDLTVTGDPHGALLRLRGAGAERMRSFAAAPGTRAIRLERNLRNPERVQCAARVILGESPSDTDSPPTLGDVRFWRCANRRAQAQTVASEIERLVSREQVEPGAIAVLVPSIVDDGQAVAVALEERAVAHRLVGEAAFFQRAEIRDVLAWLRLLVDPSDAAAVVRALAPGVPEAVPLWHGGARYGAPGPVRASADRADRAPAPAAIRSPGGCRAASAGPGTVQRACCLLRPPLSSGHRAGVRPLDRGRRRLRAARAGGARPHQRGRSPGGAARHGGRA